MRCTTDECVAAVFTDGTEACCGMCSATFYRIVRLCLVLMLASVEREWELGGYVRLLRW
jgi:hypothetical protein